MGGVSQSWVFHPGWELLLEGGTFVPVLPRVGVLVGPFPLSIPWDSVEIAGWDKTLSFWWQIPQGRGDWGLFTLTEDTDDPREEKRSVMRRKR